MTGDGELYPPRDWDAAYGRARSSSRSCRRCSLNVQGGEWGMAAHLFAIHGEGEDPGPCPDATPRDKPLPKRWTVEQRAAFHARNRAARQRRYTSPGRPGPGGPPPAGTG